MTHFDFKTLLPALLQVEDRVSMAHGLESRVPFLDHPLVEFAATMPSNVKFKAGTMKHILKKALGRGFAAGDCQPQGQDGLSGAVNGMDAGAGPGICPRCFSSRQASPVDW